MTHNAHNEEPFEYDGVGLQLLISLPFLRRSHATNPSRSPCLDLRFQLDC